MLTAIGTLYRDAEEVPAEGVVIMVRCARCAKQNIPMARLIGTGGYVEDMVCSQCERRAARRAENEEEE